MITDSEYNNAGELLGELAENELLGALNKMNVVQRAKTIGKIARNPAPSKASRAEFEKTFAELPDHIKEGLQKGKLRLADHIVYSIKAINGSKTVKMFESQDVKQVGLRNITAGRLPKNMAMLVSGIFVLQTTAATAGTDDIISATYDYIDSKPSLVTGEFTFKANKKQLMADSSMTFFKTSNMTHIPKGYYKLHNPRLIHDDVDIEFDIELGSTTGLDATKGMIFLGLHGTVTIP